MKKSMRTLLASVVAAAAVIAILALTSIPAEAVGCPPPTGKYTKIMCGGIAGIPCPGNLVCIDDPRDNCCPQTGGADCSGVCARR